MNSADSLIALGYSTDDAQEITKALEVLNKHNIPIPRSDTIFKRIVKKQQEDAAKKQKHEEQQTSNGYARVVSSGNGFRDVGIHPALNEGGLYLLSVINRQGNCRITELDRSVSGLRVLRLTGTHKDIEKTRKKLCAFIYKCLHTKSSLHPDVLNSLLQ
uniref:Uncharacterized protein n=1 Tax=Ditylenchus dipsaci TaxID=166011 RepID=A0A915CXT1_9BILA